MLDAVNEVLVAALSSLDPLKELAAAVERAGPRLDAGERAALLAVDPDGFVLTGLLVKKLRFERVVLGDRALAAAFEADPARFTADWKRYHEAVPPRFFSPEDEARAFHAFLAG